MPHDESSHPMPGRFSFAAIRGGFAVSYRWYCREQAFWMIFILPVWLMFGLSMPSWVFSQIQEDPGLLFSSRTVGVGLFALLSWFILYAALVFRFNRTRLSLRVAQEPMPQRGPLQRSEGFFVGALSIRHGPLPWRRSITVSTETLRDVFCQTLQEEDDEAPLYLLVAAFQDGSRKVLLYFSEEEEARFLGEKIRASFRLKSALMPGG